MNELKAITVAIGGLKTAFDIAKALKSADVSLGEAELKLKLIDLINALADAKINVSDVQDVIRKKEIEITRLKEVLRLKKKLVRFDNAYYEVDKTGKRVGDPYCSYCFEVKLLPVHMIPVPMTGINMCPECKTKV